ncbi:MAG TPA: AMP-binding protein, partial [Burkholderiales bacterium]
MVADTYPRLLLHHAEIRGGRAAMREKDLGIWQSWTWKQYAEEVRRLACGLAALGFRRGMNLAVIGDNRPRLYWSFAAAQTLGGVPVPLYQVSVAQEMLYVLDNAEIEFAIVEDQEQVDKLLELLPQCPRLKHIIYD